MVRYGLSFSHFPIESRKAAMDCLVGEGKLDGILNLKLEHENNRNISDVLSLRKSLKSCLHYSLNLMTGALCLTAPPCTLRDYD